jgi:hypothetical protein
MKILVIGGMHGNEPLGLEVVKLFKESPMTGVDVVIANKDAVEANRRFLGKDLNRSFPGNGTAYEDERAQELLNRTKGYDVALDFHNTYCPNNDCGFVGEDAPKSLYDISCLLGLDKVIVADYDCINKYATNCLSVEISLDSALNSAELWYERIVMLSRLNGVSVDSKVETYKFVYRITVEDRDTYSLSSRKLIAFKPLDKTLASSMGIKSPAYPIFIGDKFTPYNYGGLLNKIQ